MLQFFPENVLTIIKITLVERVAQHEGDISNILHSAVFTQQPNDISVRIWIAGTVIHFAATLHADESTARIFQPSVRIRQRYAFHPQQRFDLP